MKRTVRINIENIANISVYRIPMFYYYLFCSDDLLIYSQNLFLGKTCKQLYKHFLNPYDVVNSIQKSSYLN
jgi:hypothetical protein